MHDMARHVSSYHLDLGQLVPGVPGVVVYTVEGHSTALH